MDNKQGLIFDPNFFDVMMLVLKKVKVTFRLQIVMTDERGVDCLHGAKSHDPWRFERVVWLDVRCTNVRQLFRRWFTHG